MSLRHFLDCYNITKYNHKNAFIILYDAYFLLPGRASEYQAGTDQKTVAVKDKTIHMWDGWICDYSIDVIKWREFSQNMVQNLKWFFEFQFQNPIHGVFWIAENISSSEMADSDSEFMEEDDKPPQAALGSFKGSLNKSKKVIIKPFLTSYFPLNI